MFLFSLIEGACQERLEWCILTVYFFLQINISESELKAISYYHLQKTTLEIKQSIMSAWYFQIPNIGEKNIFFLEAWNNLEKLSAKVGTQKDFTSLSCFYVKTNCFIRIVRLDGVG